MFEDVNLENGVDSRGLIDQDFEAEGDAISVIRSYLG